MMKRQEMCIEPLALGDPVFCSACLQPLFPWDLKKNNGITPLLNNSRAAWCSDGSEVTGRGTEWCWHPTLLENKQY